MRITVFAVLAYTIALVLDFATLMLGPSGTTLLWWGIARMWSVALSVAICLKIFGEGVAMSFKKLLTISKKVLMLYFLAPLIVYGALGLYVAITLPLGLFDFNAVVNAVAEVLKGRLPASIPEEEVMRIAAVAVYAQLVQGYVTAITINALAALGEEIGWRGYLYSVLDRKPSLRNTVIIGALWGLWHASAIILLGYNYAVNRYVGVALFMLLAIAFTYPHLLSTTASNSVLPAASLHGAINALWSLTVIASTLPREVKELLLGLGALGIAVWILVDVMLHVVCEKLLKQRWRASMQRFSNTILRIAKAVRFEAAFGSLTSLMSLKRAVSRSFPY